MDFLGLHFTPDVNVGTVIAVVSVLVVVYKAHRANIERFIALETKVGLIFKSLKIRFHPNGDDNDDSGS